MNNVYSFRCGNDHPVNLTVSDGNTIWLEAYCPICKRNFIFEERDGVPIPNKKYLKIIEHKDVLEILK